MIMTRLFPRPLILRSLSACWRLKATWSVNLHWTRDHRAIGRKARAGFLSEPRRVQTFCQRRSDLDLGSFSSAKFVPCSLQTREVLFLWNFAISSFGFGTKFLPEKKEFAKTWAHVYLRKRYGTKNMFVDKINLPESLWDQVSSPVSFSLVCWCISVSETSFPALYAVRRRKLPV